MRHDEKCTVSRHDDYIVGGFRPDAEISESRLQVFGVLS